MNNKFLPYKEIETEAVLQLDDDVLMAPEEIEFGFRQVYVLGVMTGVLEFAWHLLYIHVCKRYGQDHNPDQLLSTVKARYNFFGCV